MSDVTDREMQAGGLPWSEPISLSVSVMLEGWTDSGAPGLGPMGNPLREGVLDLQARSWAEYGPNRGAEHILRVFKRHGVSAVFYVSGIVAERCATLVAAIAKAGHTVAAHGWAQDLLPAYRSEERDDLARSRRALEAAAGAPPLGYMSPRCTPSGTTAGLLSELGFLWTADVFDRDLPGRLMPGSRLIGVPFTTVVNDMPLTVRYGDNPEAYTVALERIIANWSRSGLGSACLDLTVHSHVFGRPPGIIELDAALALARGARDVRLTNHLELARCCGAWLASAREEADA
jgi:Polysaccharide deacetylase